MGLNLYSFKCEFFNPAVEPKNVPGPTAVEMIEKLKKELKPKFMRLTDDSHAHAGHAAMKERA